MNLPMRIIFLKPPAQILFFIFTCFFVFSFSSVSFSQTTNESPRSVIVTNIQAQGSGCPAGTASASISPDGSDFTLLMDNYQASSNGNNQIDRKMCEVKIDFTVEPGWSYALVSADYRGFANVVDGSIALHQAIYSFDGSRPINERPGFENGKGHSFRAQEFRGPYSDNYTIHSEIPLGQAPWSSCNQSSTTTLNITTYLMARSISKLASTEAQITLDSIDGFIQTQKYRFAWRKCRSNNDRGGDNGRIDNGRGDPGRGGGRPPRYPRTVSVR